MVRCAAPSETGPHSLVADKWGRRQVLVVCLLLLLMFITMFNIITMIIIIIIMIIITFILGLGFLVADKRGQH